jgi:hypothetical protein
VLLLLAAVGAGYVAYELTRPYAAFSQESIIDFPKGTSTTGMASRLANAGVIAHVVCNALPGRTLGRRV